MTRDVKNMSRILSNTKEMTRGCWAMLGKLQRTFRKVFGVIMKDARKTLNSAKEMLKDIKQCFKNSRRCQIDLRKLQWVQSNIEKIQKMMRTTRKH